MTEEQKEKKIRSIRKTIEDPPVRSPKKAAAICRHIAELCSEHKLPPYWEGPFSHLWLYQADCFHLMDLLRTEYPNGVFDMIFVDPPNHLSNAGFTCRSGRQIKTVQADLDDLPADVPAMHEYNLNWISRCRDLLTPNGTLWVSGTHHIIFSVGFALQSLGMRILNSITWEKTNPPPNLSCRFFTHSTETLIWAAKSDLSKHVFNDKRMRRDNNGKQMKSVWKITSPSNEEKKCGRHPAQKPVRLLDRIIKASTSDGSIIFDPFTGSATTGIAALRECRYFIGCETNKKYIELSKKRLEREESPLVDLYE